MKKRKKIIIILCIFCLMLICGGLYINHLLNKTNNNNIDKEINDNIIIDNTKNAHKVVNIMLMGADNYNRDYNSYNEQRIDAIKVLSLDYTEKTIKITSLNEEVVAWLPSKNKFDRFKYAYIDGNPGDVINTINYNLDLDVKDYVSFSFAGFIDVIDEIGGIDIDLTKKEANALNNPAYGDKVSIVAKEGMNHLGGKEALTYARINYLDSDFIRIDRENKVINATISKLKNTSIDEILKVINVCLPSITTSFEIKEIKSYLIDAVKFDLKNIQEYTYPNDYKNNVAINNKTEIGGYILKSYSDQVIGLHKFIYGTEEYKPTSTIYTNEERTYKEVCEFYENSKLLH